VLEVLNEFIFPSIDTPTLALARAIIQLTLAGLIIWTGSRQQQRMGTHWWAWGLALHGIGLLVFLVDFAPLDSLIVAVNHMSLGLSSACILLGFWQFGQRPAQRWLILLLVAIPATSMLLWEWWMPNARMRILFTASGQFIFLLLLQATLAVAPRKEMAGIYRSLRWIVSAYAVLLLWSYGSLAELLPGTARVPPGYHGILFSLGSMLFMLAMAVSFLALQYALMACRHADQARTDWLTQLLNRRGLLAAVDAQYGSNAAVPGFALLTLDVDHFKSINDHHGHAVGDRVLRALAREITRHTGANDLIARVGGEEFQILLSSADADSARSFAESLCRSCAGLEIEARSELIWLTVSIGVAIQVDRESFDDVAQRADRALYRAKNSGRNCVVLSSQP